ncbi:MAG: DUF1800 domain-containing protein [Gemmatimonadota bacterium]
MPRRRLAASALLLVASAAGLAGQESPEVRSGERERIAHLLQRATFGIRPGDVEAALSLGREAWLDRQLSPGPSADPRLESRLAPFRVSAMGPAELFEAYPPPQVLRERFGPRDSLSPAMRRELRMASPARLAAELAAVRLTRAVYAERQLEEVMVDFWFNHFNVFFGKGADRWLVADYERTAIRPHVFGRFEDLLVATASHPAMLFYLDNWRSSVPDSLNPRARRRGAGTRGRNRGLNENYARELLELHTLGVDGGYTQEDVVQVARAFTGWTITRPGSMERDGGRVEFVFRPFLHDPGVKHVLGRTLPAGRGMRDGLDVLHLLATHPATARHIATLLIRRLATDDPSPAFVEEIARVFESTDGDLAAVTRAVLTSDRFYAPGLRNAKLRTPFELVAASLRATGAEIGNPAGLLQVLRSLRQLPYQSEPPTGYPLVAEEWANGGDMLQRMNFALAFASGHVRGVRLDIDRVPGLSGGSDGEPAEARVRALARSLIPGASTDALAELVTADLAASATGTPARAKRRALGLVLGSPEFQHH